MSVSGGPLKDRLVAAEIRHLVSVANGEAGPLYFACRSDPCFTVIDTCREGEAVGICAGLHVGGARSLLSMENFGLFECLDTLRALPIDMGIPQLVLVGYTGRPSAGVDQALDARLGTSATQAALGGRWTEPVLDLAGMPHRVLVEKADAELVDWAARTADERRGPVALLVESMQAGPC